MTLVVVDGREQAEAFLRGKPPGPALAVDAEAQALLREFRVPEEFYSPEDCLPLRQDAAARADHLCEQLEEWARAELWPDAPEAFRPGRAFAPAVRRLLEQARFAEWRLRKTGAELAYYQTLDEEPGDDLLPRAESVWSRAAERLHGQALPLRPAKGRAPAGGAGMVARLKESVSRGKAGLVLLGGGAELEALGREAALHGMPVRPLEPAALDGSASNAAFGRSCLQRLELRDLRDGSCLDRRLTKLAAELYPRAEALYRAALSWLSRHRVHAAAASEVGWREAVFFQACRAAGVKTAVWEGPGGLLRGEAPPDCDVLLAAGPAARKSAVPAGSARLDALFAGLGAPAASSKPLYLYVAEPPDSRAWPQRRRPPAAALELRRRTAALFEGADAELKVVAPAELPAFLGKADAFLFDEPSGALLAAALTSRPIFYLDALACLEWTPEGREAVSSRCVLVEALEQLPAKLGGRLATGRLDPVTDRWLVESYGVTKLDGESARRAWAALAP